MEPTAGSRLPVNLYACRFAVLPSVLSTALGTGRKHLDSNSSILTAYDASTVCYAVMVAWLLATNNKLLTHNMYSHATSLGPQTSKRHCLRSTTPLFFVLAYSNTYFFLRLHIVPVPSLYYIFRSQLSWPGGLAGTRSNSASSARKASGSYTNIQATTGRHGYGSKNCNAGEHLQLAVLKEGSASAPKCLSRRDRETTQQFTYVPARISFTAVGRACR